LLRYSQNTAGDYFYLPHPVDLVPYRLIVHFVTLVKIPTFSYSDRAIVLYTVLSGLSVHTTCT